MAATNKIKSLKITTVLCYVIYYIYVMTYMSCYKNDLKHY